MNFLTILKSKEQSVLADSLSTLLSNLCNPVLGASKSIEYEIAVVTCLQSLGLLNEKLDEYDLVFNLKITKTKARNLIYQKSLRESSEDIFDFDQSLVDLLCNTRIIREGKWYVIEVPNPFTMDLLKSKIRKLGFISDGSFSASIAKIQLECLSSLIESLIPEENKNEIILKLKGNHLKGELLKGLISGALAGIGKKIAGETGQIIGEEMGESLSEFISDFFVKKKNQVFAWVNA
jgi:hypothetical protein